EPPRVVGPVAIAARSEEDPAGGEARDGRRRPGEEREAAVRGVRPRGRRHGEQSEGKAGRSGRGRSHGRGARRVARPAEDFFGRESRQDAKPPRGVGRESFSPSFLGALASWRLSPYSEACSLHASTPS